MINDFDSWNNKKKHLEAVDNLRSNFSEREVWWCSLGKNIGDEENGKNDRFERPVLILKKFSRNSVVVIPLTTKGKSDSIFYYQLLQGENSWVILSQIRLLSTKRFLRKMYKVGRGEFLTIKSKTSKLIF
jgi:mRNA interferase MazF